MGYATRSQRAQHEMKELRSKTEEEVMSTQAKHTYDTRLKQILHFYDY